LGEIFEYNFRMQRYDHDWFHRFQGNTNNLHNTVLYNKNITRYSFCGLDYNYNPIFPFLVFLNFKINKMGPQRESFSDDYMIVLATLLMGIFLITIICIDVCKGVRLLWRADPIAYYQRKKNILYNKI